MFEFIGKNIFVGTTSDRNLSDAWNVKNGVHQGVTSSGILFNFYLDEVIREITELPVGCSLSFSRVNILCYADDIALLAPTAQALQIMMDTLTARLYDLSLKINIEKYCSIVFRRNKKRVSTRFTSNSLPLRQVTECTYLGAVLSDDLFCTKEVERAKLAYFKQFNPLYQKFSFANKDVLIHLFKLHVMSFYGAETWVTKLYVKDVKIISKPYHKAIKRICGQRPSDSNHECLEQVKLWNLT